MRRYRRYKSRGYRRRYKNAIFVLFILVVIEALLIIHLSKKEPEKKLKEAVAPLKKPKGEIAFVIDDWGYNPNNLDLVSQIKYPLTLAILPNLAYSSVIAQELHARGFEIILHLPMEPYEKYNLEKNTLLTSMDEFKIGEIINQDLKNIGYCRGVSNHMGSKVTSDPATMSIIFRELKKKRLYFLDSFVSSNSICFELAKKMNLKFTKRNIFLDNGGEAEYIKGQIYKLKKIANLRGKAVGIGHNRQTTLETLKEVMPHLEKEGYRFVFVSDLID